MGQTPEQLEERGVELKDLEALSDEWRARIEARLPRTAPAVRVGGFTYDARTGLNRQVVRVEWERGSYYCPSGWRYAIPGHGGIQYPNRPRPSAPFVFNQEVSRRCNAVRVGPFTRAEVAQVEAACADSA